MVFILVYTVDVLCQNFCFIRLRVSDIDSSTETRAFKNGPSSFLGMFVCLCEIWGEMSAGRVLLADAAIPPVHHALLHRCNEDVKTYNIITVATGCGGGRLTLSNNSMEMNESRA